MALMYPGVCLQAGSIHHWRRPAALLEIGVDGNQLRETSFGEGGRGDLVKGSLSRAARARQRSCSAEEEGHGQHVKKRVTKDIAGVKRES